MSTRRARIAAGLALLTVVGGVGVAIFAQREEPLAVFGRFTHPRFGSVIDVPAGFAAFPDGTSDLLILPTPRSWDGNLMLDPFGNAPEEATVAWGR